MPQVYDMRGVQSAESAIPPAPGAPANQDTTARQNPPTPPTEGFAEPIVKEIRLTTQVDVTTGEIKEVWVGMEADRDPRYPASASADRLWDTLSALTERYRLRALENGK